MINFSNQKDFKDSLKYDPSQIIFCTKDDYKERFKEYVNQETHFFSAKKGECFRMQKDQRDVFFVAIENKDYAKVQAAAKSFSWNNKDYFSQEQYEIVMPADWEMEQAEAALLGLLLGSYSIDLKNPHPFKSKDIDFVLADKFKADALGRTVLAIAQGQFLCMDWLNKAPNHKNSEMIGAFAQELAKDLGVSCSVYNREQSRAKGLEAFLSVNQGSAFDAAFTVLEYKPENAKTKVGIVGKCVTFDTGGISIKGSLNMHYMKSDMGGATAVMGTFYAAVKLNLPIHLVVILPATDNAVDKNAYLPGDVIPSHAGKTIEVINTDAEGRMTLADGLSYMVKEHKPDWLLDIATLTGSSVRTFGYKCAALLSNNQDFKNKIQEAGNQVNQRSWELPLWDDYLEDIKSDVADLQNCSSAPMSDCIIAAKFLQQFTHEHTNWAHLDIAGVAFGKNAYAHDKSATGFGVQLLTKFLRNL